MAEPLDLTAIRSEIEGHLAELPQDVTCCPGCRVALEAGPALVAEVERLRARLSLAEAVAGRVRGVFMQNDAAGRALTEAWAAWEKATHPDGVS